MIKLISIVSFLYILLHVLAPPAPFYHRHTKKTEAKVQLSAAYTSQIANFYDHKTYTFNLVKAGYDPHGERDQRYYTILMNPKCAPSPLKAPNKNFIFEYGKKVSNIGRSASMLKEEKDFLASETCKDLKKGFDIYAFGNINGKRLDIWKINEKKELIHIQDGTPESIRSFSYNVSKNWRTIALVIAIVLFIGSNIILFRKRKKKDS